MRGLAAAAVLAALPAGALAGVRPAYGGTIRVGLPSLPRLPPGSADADLLVARATSAMLLEVDAAGGLAPGALAEVPVPEAGGRAFRLRLRPDLVDARGRPLGAADVALRLRALLSREAPSPWAFVALPIQGADAALEGRAAAPAGVQVLSATEILVTLAFPLPEFPWLLATPPAALPDAGPFTAVPGRSPSDPVVLAANGRHLRGRPFADAIELRALDARGAARLVEQGGIDLVLRPEAVRGTQGPALPALAVTVAAVNAARLGASAEPLWRALASVDRAEIARRFVRGPGEPLSTIVPPAILPGAAPAPAAGGGAFSRPPPGRIAILASSAAPDHRAIAERLQVKLWDAGIRASVEVVDPARFAARLASGDHDVALLLVPVLAPKAALAAGQVAFAARGAAAARRAMAALSGLSPEAALAAADRLARELAIVPLVASGWRASPAARLEGLSVGGDGAFDAGNLWLLGGGGP